MAFDQYRRYDAIGLAGLIRSGQSSAAEIVETAIAAAERLNPVLNAIVAKDYTRARRAAAAPPDGPFCGVPFLLKDISAADTATPARQGSRFCPPVPADCDSDLALRFRRAGLICFGRTNVPEFGLVPTTEGKLYGAARNPWNLNLSPGGSSGGAAAAVAAGIVPMAHANDGGGSIRIPASSCGLVGLKPSRGRVLHGPSQPDGVDGLAADLVLSRSVRDTAAALDAAANDAPHASFLAAIATPPKPLRIAFTASRPDGSAIAPECARAVEHAARLCCDLGHHVEDAAPRYDSEAFLAGFADLWTANLAAAIDAVAEWTGTTPGPDRLEGFTLASYERGKQVDGARILRSKTALHRVTRAMAEFHARFDLWLTPVLGELPWALGRFDPDRSDYDAATAEFNAYVPFAPLQNVTGQPAIALPLYRSESAIPIGVQFAAAFGGEAVLLQLAAQLEAAAPWAHHYESIGL